jgi:mono/diheme cytochrome c family protein
MLTVRRIIAVACFTLASASVGSAEDLNGDAAAGRRLAEGTCQTCHQIDRTQAPVEGGGPAWTAIANMPSTTHLSLAVFLQSSHRNMPNLILAPREIDDLAAFILSLKDGAAKP